MMIELKCLTCIHGELCSYKHGGVDLTIISGDCKSYKSATDVVPKSEVDRLVDKWIGDEKLTQDEKTLRLIEQLKWEAKRYERYYFNHEYDKLIAEAKQEVAREIFEDIKFEIHQLMFVSDEEYGYAIEKVIADLEKKYTESGSILGEWKFAEKISHEQPDLSDAKFIDKRGHIINRDDGFDWDEAPPYEESEGKE